MFTKSTQRPLVTKIILFTRFIRDKLIIFLIDRVVRQMHKLILLVDLLSIRLRCKPSQPLLMHVNSKWFIACDADIYAQFKLVSIDQQRIRDILRYHRSLVNIHIIDVINQKDAIALARVRGLDDPNVFLALVLSQLLVVIVEVSELLWQDVGVWCDVYCGLAVFLLHTHYVVAHAILPCNLERAWELV